MTDQYAPLDRVRSFSETMSVVFEVVRGGFKSLMILLLTVAGPFIILGAICAEYAASTSSMTSILDSFKYGMNGAESLEEFNWLALLASSLLTYLGMFVAFMVVLVYGLEYHRLRRFPDPSEVRQAMRGIWLRSAGTTILMMIAIFLAFIVFVLPGIYLMIALSLSLPALLVEGSSAGAAISRSMKLTKNDWWWSFLFLLLMYIFTAVMGFVMTFPGLVMRELEVLSLGTSGDAFSLVMSMAGAAVRVLGQVAGACIGGLIAIPVAVLYYREVERTEGSGLFERIGSIGGDAV